jgi:hypothetical protein
MGVPSVLEHGAMLCLLSLIENNVCLGAISLPTDAYRATDLPGHADQSHALPLTHSMFKGQGHCHFVS